jgi:hypothetical protein
MFSHVQLRRTWRKLSRCCFPNSEVGVPLVIPYLKLGAEAGDERRAAEEGMGQENLQMVLKRCSEEAQSGRTGGYLLLLRELHVQLIDGLRIAKVVKDKSLG